MDFELLASTIVRMFSSHTGLGAIQLHPQIDSSGTLPILVTKSLAYESPGQPQGLERDEENPLGILVDATDDLRYRDRADLGSLRVATTASSLEYRFGNRLAVCVGSTDLSSFFNAFPVLFPINFPLVATRIELEKFASHALSSVAANAGSTDFVASPPAVEQLIYVLELLRDAYVELTSPRGIDSDLPSYVLWFRHVGLALHRMSAELLTEGDDADVSQAIEKAFWPSFSLPMPDHGNRYLKKHDGKAFARRCLEAWSDHDAIEASIDRIESVLDAGRGTHALRGLLWADFDNLVETGDTFQRVGPLMAWAIVDSLNSRRSQIFTAFFEREYFELSSISSDEPNPPAVSISYEEDDLDLTAQIPGGTLNILERSSVTIDSGRPVLKSDPIKVNLRLPGIDGMGVDGSEFRVNIAQAGYQVIVDNVVRDGTEVAITCRIERKLSYADDLRDRVKLPVKIVELSLSVHGESELFDLLPVPITQHLLLVPPNVGGAIFLDDRSAEIKKIKIAGWGEVNIDADEDFDISTSVKLVRDSSLNVVCISRSGSVLTSVPQLRFGPVVGRPLLVVAKDYSPENEDEFRIGELRINVEVDERESESPESPIVAAILKVRPKGGRPKESHRGSLRGVLEAHLGELIISAEFASSLGHVALPADFRDDIGDIGLTTRGLISTTRGEPFCASIGEVESISSDLLTSPEVQAFQSAFKSLNLAERLTAFDKGEGSFVQLVSRVSLRDLAGSPELARYLDSFVELVKRAEAIGDDRGRFWASFPFSASIWGTVGGLQCRSVLISPFHPIRLSWLASVEDALWASPNAASLSGAIEGWNFPRLGPTNTRQGRLVAIPSDSGEDQLFVGWAHLVRASIDGPQPLTPTDFAASLPLPGSSSSGLNGAAVTAALQDFRRVHSYMRTISVDLAATSKSPKMFEIDQAVVDNILSSELEQPIAGIRVFDSVCRVGEIPVIPITDAAELTPLTWKRYDPNSGESGRPQSNLRILQDSGIAVEVQTRQSGRSGLLGSIPLRRFEVSHRGNLRGNGLSISQPGLRRIEGVDGFFESVDVLESLGGVENAPEIQTTIPVESPLGRLADWVISGEALVSPAALTEMLNRDAEVSRMLWEWNPPFLAPTKKVALSTSIDKRAYFSVARVPDVFLARLKEKLGWLRRRPVNDQDASRVLGYLAAQGIGLSRLVAIGGSQLHGALGFYQCYKLFECVKREDSVRLILPLDACQRFLDVIATNRQVDSGNQRADLLIIDVQTEGLVLTPVEIKFYGLEQPIDHLPQLGSAALAEARKQAFASRDLLERICAAWEDARSAQSRDLPLIANALSALLEAAIRLSPIDEARLDDVVATFSKVIAGTAGIQVGCPVVAFFCRALDPPFVRADSRLSSDEHPCEWAEFIADSSTVFEEVESGVGTTVDEWSSVIEWATSFAISEPREEIAESTQATSEMNTPAVSPETETERKNDVSGEASPEEMSIMDREELEGVGGQKQNVDGETIQEDGTHLALDPTRVPSPDQIVGNENSVSDSQLVVDDGVRFVVGNIEGSLRNAEADFWPANTNLNQLNIGVVGDLGTGKTQLLQALVYQLRNTAARHQTPPVSALILDYKRDYQNPKFLSSVGGQAFEPVHIPLDIFGLQSDKSPRAIQAKARSFADVVSRIFAGVGPRQISALTRSIRNLVAASSRPPTMKQVLDSYLADVGDADSVVAILENFVESEIFSTDPDQLQPLGELLRDKVMVVNLAALGADQDTKNALVALFLNQYYEYMLSLTKWRYTPQEDHQLRALNSYLLVDEATNIMQYKFDVLSQILLQGREFGVGVMLSSQYLSHFDVPGVNYAEPLRTWFIHKVPNVTQRQLVKIGLATATQADADRISDLPIHHAYYVSYRFNGRFIRGNPFFEVAPED